MGLTGKEDMNELYGVATMMKERVKLWNEVEGLEKLNARNTESRGEERISVKARVFKALTRRARA